MSDYEIDAKKILLPEGRFVWRWFIMRDHHPLFMSNAQRNWGAVWRVCRAFQARHTNIAVNSITDQHGIRYERKPLERLPATTYCRDILEIYFDTDNWARMRILLPCRKTVLHSRGYRTTDSAVVAASKLREALRNFRFDNHTVGIPPGVPPEEYYEIKFKRRPRLKGDF